MQVTGTAKSIIPLAWLQCFINSLAWLSYLGLMLRSPLVTDCDHYLAWTGLQASNRIFTLPMLLEGVLGVSFHRVHWIFFFTIVCIHVFEIQRLDVGCWIEIPKRQMITVFHSHSSHPAQFAYWPVVTRSKSLPAQEIQTFFCQWKEVERGWCLARLGKTRIWHI